MEYGVRLWIPIKPMGAPRPRVTKNGTYNDPKYTAYKYAITLTAKSKKPTIIEGPVFMKIEFFFDIPQSWSKSKRESAKWHTSKPDADNLIKGVKDALNGIVYKDDAQVCFVQARKQYSQEFGIMVEIEPA